MFPKAELQTSEHIKTVRVEKLFSGYGFDFHQCAHGQCFYGKSRPGGGFFSEIFRIYFIHSRKIGNIA